MKKAIIFVDANNFYHCVKKVISPSVLDISKISKELCKIKGLKLADIYWYASVPDIRDGVEIYNRHRGFLLELVSRKNYKEEVTIILNMYPVIFRSLDAFSLRLCGGFFDGF